jgi:IS5 family transposase
MVFQMPDRLSVKRFVRVRQGSQVSDRDTLRTFRERPIKAGASKTLFEAAKRELLPKHGDVARGEQIIDASIAPVPLRRMGKDEKELVEQPATPADGSPPRRRQKDTEASWAKKRFRKCGANLPRCGSF